MLSVAKFNAGSGAAIEKYMRGEINANHREDYYSAEQKGQWHGDLAKELGLSGEVKNGELAAVLNGYNPATGEALAKNPGAEHAPGWDCTFSAPKSVSLEWAMNPAARADIEAAQQRSATKALDYLAENGITNRDRHGEHAGQPAGEIIAATYQHGASREGDPQLHTHCAVANVTQRPDGTFAAADLDTRWKMAAGAVYRAELASEMQKLGYAVERDGTSFRLQAADKKMEEEFSKRAAAINAAAKGKSYQEERLVVKDSRKNKDQTPAELRASWDAAAKEIGYQPLPRDAQGIEKAAMPLPDDFIKTAMGNQSTMTEMQLNAAVMVESQGKMTVAEAREYLAEVKRSGETVELVADKANGRGTAQTEARYTSREMFQIEKGIGDRAVSMAADRTSPGAQAVDQRHIEAAINSKTLSDEQKAALKHITSEGRTSVVQGTAGAGKSYMLDAARDAFERDGRQVIGCALSGKAAEGLQDSSGIKSETIHRTLDQIDKGEITLTNKTVIVMDEAGMTGSRLMADLQNRIDEAGGKFILVQDTRQLQPVDAGGGGREVQNKIGACEMNEIRRQKDPDEQRMVHDFKDGRAEKALDYLESKDRLKSYDTVAEARQECAKAVVSDLAEGKTSISMADTRAACKEMNAAAREQMRERGMLKSDDKSFKCEDRDSNTSVKQFAEGDRVIFLKNDRNLDVKNGTTGTVTKAQDGRLEVKLDGKDKTVKVDQAKYQKIDHGYAFTVHKSQGVTVDKAHYAPGQMADRELGYVAGSRHREEFTLHAQKDRLKDLREDLEKSHAKGTSQDYKVKDARDPRDPPAPPGKPGEKDKPQEVAKREPAVRLAPRGEDVKRDGELARKALESHSKGRQAPDGKALDKAVKDGKLQEVRDSKGEKYYTDKQGRVMADRLRDSKLQCREITDRAGLRTTRLVDNRVGRVRVAGAEVFKGVKVGSKVVESQGLTAAAARSLKTDLNKGQKEKASWLKTPLRKAADKVLTKAESWKEAGAIRNIAARVEMGLKTKGNEREAVKALETKSAAGKQIEQREKATTEQIKQSAAAKEQAKPPRDPAMDRMRDTQQLNRDLSKPIVAPPPPPPIEIKPSVPVLDVGRSLER